MSSIRMVVTAVSAIAAASAAFTPAQAQAQTQARATDGASSNRQAVRRLFPVVTLFDRKPVAAPHSAPADAVAPASSALEAPGVADASFGSSSSDVARIRAMSVAGVALGMSPDQARTALRASGYAPTPDPTFTDRRPKVERNYDYPTKVDQVRKERLSNASTWKSTETIVAEEWNKGDEKVRVEYVPLRDVPVVADVSYRIPEGRIGWEAIRMSVTTKYGKPTRLSDSLRTVRYCGDGMCAAVGADFAELGLTAGWHLELRDGGAFARLQQRQAAEDADRSIRRTDKPSF